MCNGCFGWAASTGALFGLPLGGDASFSTVTVKSHTAPKNSTEECAVDTTYLIWPGSWPAG